MSSLFIYAILFIEGFVSISLQITTMRQLVPFVGTSVINSSLVIGSSLFALAIGYGSGGKYKKNPIKRLRDNFLIASVGLSITLSYPVISVFFTEMDQLGLSTITGLVFYLALGSLPFIVLIGMTIPLLSQFITKQTVQEITGDALSFNTLASVLGAVMTSVVLFYFVGVAVTVWIDVMLLLILSILLTYHLYQQKNVLKLKVYSFFYIGLFFVVGGIAYYFNINYEKNNFIETNAYNNYEVETTITAKEGEIRLLKMNRAYMSQIKNGKTYSNVLYFARMIRNFYAHTEAEILVLGAGGFTVSIGDKSKNKYDYVDIDGKIKSVVERVFLKHNIHGDFIAEDARVYLRKTKKKYDIILVDVFTNPKSIPWHLTTREFMQTLNKRLTETGHVIFNVVEEYDFSNKVINSIHNTIMTTFQYCYSTPLFSGKQQYLTVVYTCKKQNNPREIKINKDNNYQS